MTLLASTDFCTKALVSRQPTTRTYLNPNNHLCGEADGHPINYCHQHRRTTDDHKKSDEDSTLERELDDEVPITQRVVNEVQGIV